MQMASFGYVDAREFIRKKVAHTMHELETCLQHYFGISPQDCPTVANLFTSQTLHKSHYWLRSGTACTKLSLVHSGMLRLFVRQEDREITQWIATPGYFVTDLSSFLFETSAKFHVQALSETTMFTIERAHYLTLGSLVPQWTDCERRFISQCFISLENRVFDLISLSAEGRYQQLYHQNRPLFTQVPSQYLASMLGMTPETFSRIRRKRIS